MNSDALKQSEAKDTPPPPANPAAEMLKALLTSEEDNLTRFVIGSDVALRLAQLQAVVPAELLLLAPTLMRSQVLAQLYILVRGVSSTEKPPNASSTTCAAFGWACWATECCEASPRRSPTNSAGPTPSSPSKSP